MSVFANSDSGRLNAVVIVPLISFSLHFFFSMHYLSKLTHLVFLCFVMLFSMQAMCTERSVEFLHFYQTLLSLRLLRGRWVSLDTERQVLHCLPAMSRADLMLRDIQVSGGLIAPFKKFLFNRVNSGELLLEPGVAELVTADEGVSVQTLCNSVWPSTCVKCTAYSTMRIPDSLRQLREQFEQFFHLQDIRRQRLDNKSNVSHFAVDLPAVHETSTAISSSRKVVWCPAVGQVVVRCFAGSDESLYVAMTEPQYAVLSAIDGIEREGKSRDATVELVGAKSGLPWAELKAVLISLSCRRAEFVSFYGSREVGKLTNPQLSISPLTSYSHCRHWVSRIKKPQHLMIEAIAALQGAAGGVGSTVDRPFYMPSIPSLQQSEPSSVALQWRNELTDACIVRILKQQHRVSQLKLTSPSPSSSQSFAFAALRSTAATPTVLQPTGLSKATSSAISNPLALPSTVWLEAGLPFDLLYERVKDSTKSYFNISETELMVRTEVLVASHAIVKRVHSVELLRSVLYCYLDDGDTLDSPSTLAIGGTVADCSRDCCEEMASGAALFDQLWGCLDGAHTARVTVEEGAILGGQTSSDCKAASDETEISDGKAILEARIISCEPVSEGRVISEEAFIRNSILYLGSATVAVTGKSQLHLAALARCAFNEFTSFLSLVLHHHRFGILEADDECRLPSKLDKRTLVRTYLGIDQAAGPRIASDFGYAHFEKSFLFSLPDQSVKGIFDFFQRLVKANSVPRNSYSASKVADVGEGFEIGEGAEEGEAGRKIGGSYGKGEGEEDDGIRTRELHASAGTVGSLEDANWRSAMEARWNVHERVSRPALQLALAGLPCELGAALNHHFASTIVESLKMGQVEAIVKSTEPTEYLVLSFGDFASVIVSHSMRTAVQSSSTLAYSGAAIAIPAVQHPDLAVADTGGGTGGGYVPGSFTGRIISKWDAGSKVGTAITKSPTVARFYTAKGRLLLLLRVHPWCHYY